MAITSIKREIVSSPSIVLIVSTDNLTTITTAGYITAQEDNIAALQNGTFQWADGDYCLIYYSNGEGWFTRDATTNAFVSSSPAGSVEPLVLPTTVGQIASYGNTSGDITQGQVTIANNFGNVQAGADAVPGVFISYPATTARGTFRFQGSNNAAAYDIYLTNASMGQNTVVTLPDPGATTATLILNKSAGTQTIDTGNLTLAAGNFTATLGSVSAGANVSANVNVSAGTAGGGSPGSLISYPTTAARGSLRVSAVNNTGDTVTTISNAAMAQASVISIPDPGAATAQFGVFSTANLPGAAGELILSTASTNGGLQTAGVTIRAGVTSTYAGGGTVHTFTATGVTVGAILALSIKSQSNLASITAYTAGVDSIEVAFSADPGANTILDFISLSASI